MTKNQLISTLRDMYAKADGYKVAAIHIFGIAYASELSCYVQRELNEIAEAATGSAAYGTEIKKGRTLSEFVDLRDNIPFM